MACISPRPPPLAWICLALRLEEQLLNARSSPFEIEVQDAWEGFQPMCSCGPSSGEQGSPIEAGCEPPTMTLSTPPMSNRGSALEGYVAPLRISGNVRLC